MKYKPKKHSVNYRYSRAVQRRNEIFIHKLYLLDKEWRYLLEKEDTDRTPKASA